MYVGAFSWYRAIETADINFVSWYGTTGVLSLTKMNLLWSRLSPLVGSKWSTSFGLVCWGLAPLLFPPLATVVHAVSVPVLGAALAAAPYEIPLTGLG